MVVHAQSATPACEGNYSVPTKRHILVVVTRRLIPRLVEATLIPTALFYVSLVTVGAVAAFAVALCWSYFAVARRLMARRPVPAIVLLASVGITLRTIVAVLSQSTFLYFFQPVLVTIVLGALFLTSVAVGQPLIARFAQDFCVLPPEVEARPTVVRLYRRLTYLWAGVNLAAAGIALALLLTVPLAAYVAIKPMIGWALTSTGIALTVSASVRAARTEGLIAAVSPDGTLSARMRDPQRGAISPVPQ